MSEKELIKVIEVPITLKYIFTADESNSSFLRHMKHGKIVGQRCPSCRNVYVPPQGCCSKCGVVTDEEVELSGRGTIRYFTIVHIPPPESNIKPPFVAAQMVLDGSDIAVMHLVSEVPVEEVRIGMRVEPVWKSEDEWDYSFNNILYFKPTGEPDVEVEQV